MVKLEVSTLKRLLGVDSTDTSKDFILQFILDDVEEKVLNYCNIDEIPISLKNTCYRMAIDMYRNETLGQEQQDMIVSSISEGDTSTSFKVKEQDKTYIDSIFKDYKSQLNRYRKLVWK